jgi:hypothetical protein
MLIDGVRFTLRWLVRKRFSATNGIMNKSALGDLDRLLLNYPHTHFVTSPIFGPPKGADNATLVIAMSGDYRSKKEIAFLLVPAVGRKVIDLGGNVEKGKNV